MIPPSIPFSQIDTGSRARSEYSRIEILADDIEEAGLICPIILVPKNDQLVLDYQKEFGLALDPTKPYLLTAGGRRYWALATLEVPDLFHATTSEPGRPGFLLRDEPNLLSQLLVESKENLNRQDLDWRDQMKLIVRTFRLARREAHEQGLKLVMRDFGVTLGVSGSKLEIAERVYDHYIANPLLYKDCTSVFSALSVLMRTETLEVQRMAVTRSMSPAEIKISNAQPSESVYDSDSHKLDGTEAPGTIVMLPGQSPIVAKVAETHTIELSKSFFNCDALDFMAQQPPGFCNHIICDPDYALDLSTLDSSPNSNESVARGIPYANAQASFDSLSRFIQLAYNAITEHGFLVFWYAIDHHEKLVRIAEAAGFRVQPWPIIWNKIDFRARSNGAPNHNFPKSTEFALVCRKPGTVIAKVQNTNVFSTTARDVTKTLNHPFAKPYEIWRWIYAAVSVRGQIVFDPFCGCGSSAIEAISYGLRPIGCEIDSDLYNNLIMNLQSHYTKLLGPHVKFS